MKRYRRIRDLREDKDLRQQDMADALNTTQRTYSRYERGEREIPSEVICDIATFHDTTVDYILERTDDKRPLTPSKKNLKEKELINILKKKKTNKKK